jgi:acetoin utilization deacetylase AcuC-like enzyme
LDIGLPDGCDDSFYLRTLMNELPLILDAFEPNFIFYLSGVDVLQTDKLGRLALTKQGCKARDKYVIETAKIHKIPIVICMAGGYSEKLSDIIDAHANTFRLAQEIYF